MKTKSFKRVTSLVLTLAMLFSLAPTSFAVDDPIDANDNTIVSDNGNANQTTDNTVDAEEPASEGRKLPPMFLLTKKLETLPTYPLRTRETRMMLSMASLS